MILLGLISSKLNQWAENVQAHSAVRPFHPSDDNKELNDASIPEVSGRSPISMRQHMARVFVKNFQVIEPQDTLSDLLNVADSGEPHLHNSTTDNPHFLGPKQVPFVTAHNGLSAPAALATLLQFQHAQISAEELAAFTGRNQVEVQDSLVECARQFGFITFAGRRGPAALYEQLLAREPVMVLLNRGLRWWPVWQYVVVVGLNLDTQTVHLHSGQTQPELMKMDDFIGQWRASRCWSMSLERLEEIPQFAELEPVLDTAHYFEQGGQLDDAWTLYSAANERWPNQPAPLEGLGNIRYHEGHFQEAAAWYKRAMELARGSVTLPIRLAWALARAGHRRQALSLLDSASVRVEQSARRALARCRRAICQLPRDECVAQ